MTYYLAIDIGASSGRHILGWLQDGRICLEEIYRFENGMNNRNGSLVWDVDRLFSEVKNGIAQCKKIGKIPKTIAIDTWGVDYVLLDKDGKELLPVFAYRDDRTDMIRQEVFSLFGKEDLYSHTGIQHQDFNTVYQLYCDKKSGKLAEASGFLMMPEYLSYKLTGVKKNEYTNATTTGLVNAEKKTWDKDILSALGLPENLFSELSLPGSPVGTLLPGISEEVGFDCMVIFAPSHDTASAVAACPIDGGSVYISSGTWSLVGTENPGPVLTSDSYRANFTNEGGVEYRFRYLKNIMGMWLFQSIRKDLDKRYTYDEMMEMAKQSDFKKTFDCNDESLVAPESMIGSIKALVGKDISLGDVLSSVYYSLAGTYRSVVEDIETLSGKTVDKILIVGGGSKDRYLNELTARITGKTVVTGISEATALGNLLSQLMFDLGIDLTEARQIVKESFPLQEVKQ